MIAAASVGLLVVGVVTALVKSSGTDTTATPPVPSETASVFEPPSESPSELPSIEPTGSIEPAPSIEPTSSIEPQGSGSPATEPEPDVEPTSTKQAMPNTGVGSSPWGFAFLLLAFGLGGMVVRASRAR